MARIHKIRTPDARDVHLRALAKGRLRATILGPDHPAVEAAIRWQTLRKSAQSATTCVSDFRPFFEFCHAHGIEPFAVTRADAKLFVAEHERLDYAPTTLARRVATLRSWYTNLEDEGLAPSNPFYKVPAGNHEPVTPTPALTKEQCDQFIEMAGASTLDGSGTIHDHRNVAMAYLMVRIGPRCAEVSSATWGAIRPRGEGQELRIHGKGNRWDGTILPADVLAVLEDWQQALEKMINRPVRPTDPLFPAIDPIPSSGIMPPRRANALRPMSTRTISRVFSNLLDDIGLDGPRYSAHAGRATAATLGYAATRDLLAVQRMLRHRSQASTVVYIKNAAVDSAANEWRLDTPLPMRRPADPGSEPRTDAA